MCQIDFISLFASKNLVKHGAIASILCFDKTATSALNYVVQQGDTPIYADG
jgi:hypothetical protein